MNKINFVLEVEMSYPWQSDFKSIKDYRDWTHDHFFAKSLNKLKLHIQSMREQGLGNHLHMDELQSAAQSLTDSFEVVSNAEGNIAWKFTLPMTFNFEVTVFEQALSTLYEMNFRYATSHKDEYQESPENRQHHEAHDVAFLPYYPVIMKVNVDMKTISLAKKEY